MEFEVNDMKDVLTGIENDGKSIFYTEHYLEKIDHRYIHAGMVEDRLFFSKPDDIRKVPMCDYRFELCFDIGDSRELVVVADMFGRNSIILVSAFIKRSVERADN